MGSEAFRRSGLDIRNKILSLGEIDVCLDCS